MSHTSLMSHTGLMSHTSNYHELLHKIIFKGSIKKDRTGVGTQHLFGEMLKFPLSEGFPLITTRQINYEAVFNEFVWMVCLGSTNVNWLENRGHKFWSPWKKTNGTIGKGYGYQFRKAYSNVDQIIQTLYYLNKDPNSRRHVITTWNPQDLPEMALPPCHGIVVQFNVRDEFLDLAMYQRSADAFLGLSWNIPFYALFCHVFAHLTDLKVGELTIMLGDVHLYLNHLNQTEELLLRNPNTYENPTLEITCPKTTSINRVDIQHFQLNNYQHYPAIKAEVAI